MEIFKATVPADMERAKVGFTGLGAMGLGMASCAIKANFEVVGFDINSNALAQLKKEGGKPVDSPFAAARNADILIIVVATSDQADMVIFDESNGALAGLGKGKTMMVCITASPEYMARLGSRLKRMGRDDVKLIDCPISGGETRAWNGTLSLICAGKENDIGTCRDLLDCLGSQIHFVSENFGAASSIKMVHQILVGAHILATVEAMGLAYALGLDLWATYNNVMEGDGASWLFGQRAAHMLDRDQVPTSSLSIITKDLVSDSKLFISVFYFWRHALKILGGVTNGLSNI